jgi:hypothetical protein
MRFEAAGQSNAFSASRFHWLDDADLLTPISE